jgi:N-acetylneuraminic acid mutarotase
MIVWGGSAVLELPPGDDRRPDGYSYDPQDGTETPIVHEVYRDGAAYDPATDSWRKLTPVSLQDGVAQKAVWTGQEMLVWLRGSDEQLLGAAYDPATDSWRTLPPHPYGDSFAYATVWTGEEMIIAAGIDYSGKNPPNGAAYNPSSDTWREFRSSPLAPPDWANAIWAGTEMIVWGGTGACEGCPPWSGGLAYNPSSDTWRKLHDAPIEQRADFQAVWSGRELIIWGGQAGPYGKADGTTYEPVTDTWQVTSPSPLDGRYWASAVWTGREAIIWGGYNVYAPKGARRVFADGAAYDPATDEWAQLRDSPLSPRCGHSAVWTGTQMIVWGGTEHCGSVGPRLADGAALTGP